MLAVLAHFQGRKIRSNYHACLTVWSFLPFFFVMAPIFTCIAPGLAWHWDFQPTTALSQSETRIPPAKMCTRLARGLQSKEVHDMCQLDKRRWFTSIYGQEMGFNVHNFCKTSISHSPSSSGVVALIFHVYYLHNSSTETLLAPVHSSSRSDIG